MAESLRVLTRGANTAVADEQVSVAIDWAATRAANVFACPMTANGKVTSGRDILSIGRTGAKGPVSARFDGSRKAVFSLDLARVADTVSKIVFCVAVPAGTCDSLGAATISVSGAASPDICFSLPEDLGADAAIVMAEIYRRGTAWKFRAVGQGFKDGLERLATFLGCTPADLKDAGRAPAPPVAPASAAVAGPTPAQTPTPVPTLSPAPAPTPPRAAARVPAPVLAASSGDHFSCRGWILTEAGVGPSAPLAKGRGLHDRELLDLRSDAEGNFWPASFLYHPCTGEELPPRPQAVVTSGRTVAPGGLPHLESVKALDPESRREEAVPVGARHFASGGTPPRLVALDPADGRAWWKAPLSAQWIPLGRCPVSSLPDYAAGAVGTPGGVFYAADESLVHLLPEQAAAHRVHPLPGPSLAAPASIDGLVVVPCRTSAGIVLVTCSPDEGLDRVMVAMTAPRQVQDALAPPVINNGVAFWVGRDGFLSFDADPQRRTGAWHLWPPETEGLPFLVPYRGANGRLWAMGRQTSQAGSAGGKALACAMTAVGSKDMRPLLGPHVSIGPQTFRGRSRYLEPWGEAVEDINIGADYEGRILLPLLRLGNRETLVALIEENASAGGLRQFLFREKAAPAREIAMALHGDNRSLKLMGQTLRITSTDDIAFFLDNDRLCLHHFESNQCVSWLLSFYR